MKKCIVVLTFVLFGSFAALAQHTVVMKTGEKMSGSVESLANGVMSFKFKGNDMKLKVAEISAVYFDDKAAAEPAAMGSKTKESITRAAPKEPGEKTISAGSYIVRYKCANRTIIKAPL